MFYREALRLGWSLKGIHEGLLNESLPGHRTNSVRGTPQSGRRRAAVKKNQLDSFENVVIVTNRFNVITTIIHHWVQGVAVAGWSCGPSCGFVKTVVEIVAIVLWHFCFWSKLFNLLLWTRNIRLIYLCL